MKLLSNVKPITIWSTFLFIFWIFFFVTEAMVLLNLLFACKIFDWMDSRKFLFNWI
jgi:hypothetical protein